MDAITLLRTDHRSVEKLFKRFEKAGDGALVEKRTIVDGIVEELSVHASVEEQVFYPVCRATVPGVEDLTLESLEEHHVVKWLLAELSSLDADAERFEAKTTVLMEMVRHHVEEEETDLFPKVRAALGRRALADLGEALAQAKTTAPTSPHPRAPDTPESGGGAAGAVAGVLDRVTDNVSGVAQGTVTALQDIIARIRGSARPKVSPTGSKRTRARAGQVRRVAAGATDGLADTVRTATAGADETRRAASAGAKATRTTAKKSARATATSAKKSARATATTAKRATTSTTNAARKATSKTAASAKTGAKKTATAARGKG
jgi:hemerythrin superfamily protein